jgi:hypothetical protein
VELAFLALALAVEEFVLVWVAEQRRTRTVPRLLVVACGTTTRIDIATTDRHGGCIIIIVFIVRFNWFLCSVGRCWLCRWLKMIG